MYHLAPVVTRNLTGLGATSSSALTPMINAGGQLAQSAASGQMPQIVMSAVTMAGATVASASAMGVGWATAAIPIVGPAIAGITIGLSLLFARKGPKQKVATTQIVDAVEPKLKENLAAYLALPAHYASAQAQALANFDAGWQYVVQHCNIPEMGEPGQRCTNDRQRGGQWDWFAYYRDPIANDPHVVPDPVVDSATGEIINGISNALSGGNTMLYVAAGLIAVALLSGGNSR